MQIYEWHIGAGKSKRKQRRFIAKKQLPMEIDNKKTTERQKVPSNAHTRAHEIYDSFFVDRCFFYVYLFVLVLYRNCMQAGQREKYKNHSDCEFVTVQATEGKMNQFRKDRNKGKLKRKNYCTPNFSAKANGL